MSEMRKADMRDLHRGDYSAPKADANTVETEARKWSFPRTWTGLCDKFWLPGPAFTRLAKSLNAK